MKLIINGQEKEVKSNIISELLNELEIKNQLVVVELNKDIINKDNFENTRLNNNDKIEIITLVGGG